MGHFYRVANHATANKEIQSGERMEIKKEKFAFLTKKLMENSSGDNVTSKMSQRQKENNY